MRRDDVIHRRLHAALLVRDAGEAQGHLGDINDGWMMGVLAATEMALSLARIPHKKGGVQAAMDYIVSAHSGNARAAAE